jgi:hypothetical protein
VNETGTAYWFNMVTETSQKAIQKAMEQVSHGTEENRKREKIDTFTGD